MKGTTTMYAICFDLVTDELKKRYGESSDNAYTEIKKALEAHGFIHQQGSVYFGNMEKVNAVSCVLAVQDLAQKFDWFASSVRDIRMLRIEENNDLLPVLNIFKN